MTHKKVGGKGETERRCALCHKVLAAYLEEERGLLDKDAEFLDAENVGLLMGRSSFTYYAPTATRYRDYCTQDTRRHCDQ